ncbi:hypothetical protein DEIPH_ctg011orf0029 [Deinococcus phoenicis]|uniref:Portal protein n=1 Tax=Deinococcus phoenicis TaxID=1476583 RepID=A0A016QSQ8_9DEIO|nr:hypothetical protein [Deinococcus phoenicis]EYB69063.1 hypothetical protein DEIPH_ctg011orf0029 [Deinococcus phoenicis]
MEPEKLLAAVQAAIKAATATATDPRKSPIPLQKLRDFAQGEQIGPNLEYYPGLVPDDPAEKEALKKRLIVIALIGPILNRFTSHILGRDPEWTASADTVALEPEDERVSSLATWHTGSGRVHAELKRGDEYMRWAGVAYLHMYVPDVYRVILGKDELSRDAQTQADALELIQLDALDATQAGAVEQDGVKLAYWRAYSVTGEDGKPQNRVEVHTRTEITVYADQSGKLAPAPGVGLNPRPNPLYDPERPLRFRALIHEMKREAGPQVQQSDLDLQNGVNTTAGNVIRNNNLGGWRQYYTLDAAQPRDSVTGEKTAYTFGPARVVDVQSDYLRDAEGNPVPGLDNLPVMLRASVGTFDPVNSQFMREDADWLESKLLSRFNQLWTRDGEGQVSGESKRQSRAAFLKSLPDEAQPAQAALRWAVETADAYAQWVQGSDTLEWLNVTPRLFLDTDKVELTTLQQLDLMHTAGKLSLETLLEATPGVQDVQAELKKLQNERASNIQQAAALFGLGTLPKATVLRIAQAAGYQIDAQAIAAAEELDAVGAVDMGGQDDGQQAGDGGNAPV